MNNKNVRIGIVAEFNPFHNGHIYLINWIKNKWIDAYVIVLLSGKYVQRGELAIADFETRKQICLDYGVDEVHELKFEYATQAAHIFASGAMKQFSEIGIDIIVFGSETNNVNQFIKISQMIYQNEQEYYELIRKEMKKGISYPKANEIACFNFTKKSFIMPNDILGLEYVKAIIKNKYNIKPFCVKRNVGFHSNEVVDNITSATNIRKMIFEQNDEYKKYSPMRFDKIPDRIENYYDKFKSIVNESTIEELKNIHLMSEGMENLFKKNVSIAQTYDEFVNLSNSKRYTSSRIKRVMLYVLLNIKKES